MGTTTTKTTGWSWIGGAALALVGLLATGALAGESPDDEARAEAHRTILRRLSRTEGARTAEMRLSAAATEFVDLFLDVHRNRADIRAGTAPASGRFHGTPHAGMEVEGDTLRYRASFVNLEIDAAAMPVREVPALVDAGLDPKGFAPAGIPSDGSRLATWGRILAVEAAMACDETLRTAAAKDWAPRRARLAEVLVADLSWGDPALFSSTFSGIQAFAGPDAVAPLVRKLHEAEGKAPEWMRIALVQAVCGMEGPAARDFRRKTLRGADPAWAAAALTAWGRAPDEETLTVAEGFLAPGSTADPDLRYAAIQWFDDLATPRAQRVLERVFEDPASDREGYAAACALTRMGSEVALPFLGRKLEELTKSDEEDAWTRANVLRQLLEEHGGAAK